MTLYIKKVCADLTEWLRCQTANLMGYARTGSNPVVCDYNIHLQSFEFSKLNLFFLEIG